MTNQADARAERLKAALRANLRRRKAQARSREEPAIAQEEACPAPPEKPDRNG